MCLTELYLGLINKDELCYLTKMGGKSSQKGFYEIDSQF